MSYSGSNSSRFTLNPVSSGALPQCRSSPGRAKDASVASFSSSSSPPSDASSASPPPSPPSSPFSLFTFLFFSPPSSFGSSRAWPLPRTLVMSGRGVVGELTYTSK